MTGRALLVVLALGWWAGAPGQACRACNFGSSSTIRELALDSPAIALAKGRASRSAGGQCVPTLTVEKALRDHPGLKGMKDFSASPRVYVPLANGRPEPCVVFFYQSKGRLWPYRAIPLPSEASLAYVKRAMALGKKDRAGGLAFFFRHLEDADSGIAEDAHLEFYKAGHADLVKAAPQFDVKKLRAWLRAPKALQGRDALYARLMGVCGKKADAEFLRHLMNARSAPARDRLLAGYAMLAPREGLQYAREVLNRPTEDFVRRFTALRALQVLHDHRQGAVSKKELVEAASSLLTQDDIVDLATEALREWKAWDVADKVLAVLKRPGLDGPLCRRAVLRYCLRCKGSKAVMVYVEARRREDAGEVKDHEELLELEKAPKMP